MAVSGWLRRHGWDCYHEVQERRKGPRADIVAVRSDVCLVCEVKNEVNMKLFNQAINWVGRTNFICIAHPQRAFERRGFRPNRAEQHLLDYYGLGRIVTTETPRGIEVSEVVPPKHHRVNQTLAKNLKEEMKRYTPGLANTGYFTPWRRTMDAAVRYVEEHPGCTLREIVENIEHHYGPYSTARSCIHRWIQKEMVRTKKKGRAWTYYPISTKQRRD